jgi:hypothetical protein
MATRLVVQQINLEGLQYLDIPDGDLVYDGREFGEPSKVKYVALAMSSVNGETLPFVEPSTNIAANAYMRLNVVSRSTVSVATPNPDLILIEDPAEGQCMCGLTCTGTRLSYVQVLPVI